MSKLNFHKVESADKIVVVASLAREIWIEHYTDILKPGQAEYMVDTFQSAEAIREQIDEGYIYYLINDFVEGNIGYLSVQVQGEKIFLSKVYVKASMRGRGYGRQALNFIEEFAKEHRCSAIWLTVWKGNAESIRIYKKCGFRIIGEYIKDIGGGFAMDDHKMEKQLVL